MAKPGLKKGHTNNPNGRPKKENSIADKFRSDPRCWKVLEEIYKIALTLGKGEKEHKDAMQCAKIVADKAVPSLKAQELKMDSDSAWNITISKAYESKNDVSDKKDVEKV